MLEKLKQENCHIPFDDVAEMHQFLNEMFEADEVTELKLNSITTGSEDGELILSGSADGKEFKTNVWPFAIGSLEKRSGDDASGHSLMTDEQILNSMNNYWGLHQDKDICNARIRGDKLLILESSRYTPMRQSELLKTVTDWLEDKHSDKYTFIGGSYTHKLTHAVFEIDDVISTSYKNAWKKAGLPEDLLDSSKVSVNFYTDDIGECAAKAYIEMNVGGSRFLIGNPIEVIHKSGYGGTEKFKEDLNKIDMTIKEELDALAKLMNVKLIHPQNAAIKALKKAKIDKLSKKACKELVDDMLFMGTESAYVVYLYIHSVLDTSYGSKLSEYMKFRIVTALRGLLKEDWTKFDVPSASL